MDEQRADEVEALYRELGPAIYRRCLKLLRDPAEAQDATQEVFLRAYRNLRTLAYGTRIAWLYEIATRHCLNRLRDGVRKQSKEQKLVLRGPSADVASLFADRQQAAQVLARFDSKTSLIAVYALVDEMTQEEIAAALGITRKTVGIRLRRFLEGARNYLQRQGEP
jgi:RNA polymerase sigma-70 factor (ECF subfamily)